MTAFGRLLPVSDYSGVMSMASVILMNSSFLSIVCSAPLDLKRQLYDGSLQGELIFVDLE
jgi:hypothetical protein